MEYNCGVQDRQFIQLWLERLVDDWYREMQAR